jgi:DNA mismatch endonuclease (patch repair protein)
MTKRRYPTFTNLRPSSLASSNAKRANRSLSTKAERCLQDALRELGLRFSANVDLVLGKPDLVLHDAKIAVFCDGDFWHGRRWTVLRQALQRRANASYWVAKIAANRRRDRLVANGLRQAGWCVMRFWETDIHANANKIAEQIAAKTRAEHYQTQTVRMRVATHNHRQHKRKPSARPSSRNLRKVSEKQEPLQRRSQRL